MSNKHRCEKCNHLPGPRSTSNMSKEGNPKKASCDCVCHTKELGIE
jgi:hypothetical protein